MTLQQNKSTANIFGFIAIIIVVLFALIIFNQVSLSFGENSKYKENTTKKYTQGKDGKLKLQKYQKKIKTLTVLLVGRGGHGNDAPHLTDTIILAKLNYDKKAISLLSIPRDLYVKYPTKGAGKINSVYSSYYYRNDSDQAAGMEMLKQKVTDITGEEIDYYVNVDFQGFIKIVDTLGGIEVDVKEDLVDTRYPTANWGYKTIRFKKGIQTLNGEKALQYVRSRHSTSDFDRSLRQQSAIKAIKEKILSKDTSIKDITDIYNTIKSNVFTDISLKDTLSIFSTTDIINRDYSFISSNMSLGCYTGAEICEKGGILYQPPLATFGSFTELIDGSYPANVSNYQVSRKYANLVLNYPNVGKENFKINIFNATKRTGIAGKFVYDIRRYGFNIPKKNSIGNASEKSEKSIIYYNGIKKESETLQALKLFFSGEFVETSQPKYSTNNARIEIVIGTDYLKNKSKKDIFNF